jgi:hypothetical protein
MNTPETPPPLEPESSPTADIETGIESPAQKPRRQRRTKAEMDAIRAAKQAKALEEANKPIDPQIWLLLGGLLLFVGACIFFDPIGFSEGGQPSSQTWIFVILVMAVGILGKNPTAIVLIVLALLSLGWGVRGWIQKRN